MTPTTRKTKRSPAVDDIPITKGSGNVFADIGLEDADELKRKAKAALLIYRRQRAARKKRRKAQRSTE